MMQETMEMLEEEIQNQITDLTNYDINNEKEEKAKSNAINDLAKLLERLTEAETANEKWYDNQDRREIDRERNRTMVQIESEKNKLDWKRWVLEGAKVAIPAAVSLITLHQWSCKFERMLKFEETGHFTTSASRELHLPKLKF